MMDRKEEIKVLIYEIITILIWLLVLVGTGAFWFLVFKALIKYVF